MIQMMWQALPILIAAAVVALVVWMAVSIESTSRQRYATGGVVGAPKDGQSPHILDTEYLVSRDDPRLRCMLGGYDKAQNYAGAPDLPNRDLYDFDPWAARIASGDLSQVVVMGEGQKAKPANMEAAQVLAKLRRLGLDVRVVSAYRTPGWFARAVGAEPALIGADYIAGDMVLGTTRHVQGIGGKASHTTWSAYVRTMLSEEGVKRTGKGGNGDMTLTLRIDTSDLRQSLASLKVHAMRCPDAVAAMLDAGAAEQAVVDAMSQSGRA